MFIIMQVLTIVLIKLKINLYHEDEKGWERYICVQGRRKKESYDMPNYEQKEVPAVHLRVESSGRRSRRERER